MSVKYPNKVYEGVVDEVLFTDRGTVSGIDVDFDDGSSALVEKKDFRLVKVLP